MGISLNPSTILNGQGIDVSSLVQQILSESDGQLTQWQNEQATLQTQAGDLTSINSDLSNLATAVQALSDPLGALTAMTATSSDSSIVTATADTSATAGTHQIVVNNLATAGLVYTNDFSGGPSSSFLPANSTGGEIDLQIGGSGGTTQQIMITAGTNDTLNTLASYINSQNWGVTASVVTDATGSRLALVSQATGSAGALAITSNNTSLVFNTPTGGTNASLTIDGVPYSSASNTITGAISGVTLNLAGAASGETVQLNVGSDTSQAENAIDNFVSAYNQVINDINQQFTVDSSTNSEGPLGSDTALRSLQSSLMNDVTYSLTGSGGPIDLASFGINMNDDGTLTVGTNAQGQSLDQVLASNPTAFQNFFQNSSSTGFAQNFNTDLTNLTDPTIGVLNVDLAQNQNEQQDLSNSISNFQAQLTTEQQQLTNEYSEINASLEEYPLLLQQTTETLAALDVGSNGSSTGSSTPTLTSGL
ncbi:MAG TPA: flagellar filament capping protein FliD [Candidatus Acidoferrales bacterium]|nr:flagellar filament capping protein FliD [Candidatus Acidoferrales bacterium]